MVLARIVQELDLGRRGGNDDTGPRRDGRFEQLPRGKRDNIGIAGQRWRQREILPPANAAPNQIIARIVRLTEV
jgi:hypothetical protein